MPAAPNGISIIGCDAANGTYYQLYSDDRGVGRVYGMSIGTASGSSGARVSHAQRFTARFDGHGMTIVGRWEIAEDGTNFATDFELTYIRIE